MIKLYPLLHENILQGNGVRSHVRKREHNEKTGERFIGQTCDWKVSSCQFSQGYTLIEVLVVIGIIGILLIIMLPVYQRFIDYADEGTCIQNVRNFGEATLTGIADHNGMLVPPLDAYGDYDCEAFVAPYIQIQAICPVWKRNNPAGTTPYAGTSYVVDENIPAYFPKVNSIPLPPSRVVLASESYAGDYFSLWLHLDICMWGIPESYYSPQQEAALQGQGRPAQYHGTSSQRGLNMFMLDGSAHLVCPVTGSFQPPSSTYGAAGNSGYYYNTTQFENPSW